MTVDELEVYITPDGLGRAAIVRRGDGLLCIYQHWKWSEATLAAAGITSEGGHKDWFSDNTPPNVLYGDEYPEETARPEPGLYGTLDDARLQLRSLRGFSDAFLKTPA